jgi:NAD+ synthase (glutamine-hydrolysing)
LSKIYVREYLRWLQLEQGCNVMALINNQQPTAELRPPSANQTDEKDLMPYDLLHAIQTLAVKNRYTPVQVYKYLVNSRMVKDKGSLDSPVADSHRDILHEAIKKFFRLFATQQWKRERYALGFHMDDHNLDPRSWCRTAILSGCYEEELEELAYYVKAGY